MRRTVLLLLSSRRMMLALFPALLAFTAAALQAFAASLANSPAASAQMTIADPDEPTFGLRCDFSHRNNDDPIVYPNQPKAAHSHDFFGNRTTNAASTYDSLLTGTTTCTRPEDTASYWIPTVKWNGKNLKASRGVFYYRASGKDPASIETIPADLRVVPNTHVTWRCEGGDYAKEPPTQCSNGQLGVRVVFPDCLATNIPPSDAHPHGQDPKLDSTDHRSHTDYATRDAQGNLGCHTSTHPYPIPALSVVLRFPIPTSTGTVTLSSGGASTMHADFLNAWKQGELDRLVKHCINDFTTPEARPRPEDCK